MNQEDIKLEIEESLDLTQPEREDLEAAENITHPISYSGQDFDVDGLIRRLEARDILIPNFGEDDIDIQTAGFQRAFVWRKPQMDKFIESVLLGYPIPGVIFVKQSDERYLVLDGQQRLMTLKFFKEGVYQKREFELKNVAERFRGLTYKTLSDDLRRSFDNTFIQAIVVKSDGSEASLEAIYGIFERLNSGGTQLTAHEIRVALFAGNFISVLEELNNLPSWRSIYGSKSPRLRDQELVLRILGLYWNSSEYRQPQKKFLNQIVANNRDKTAGDIADTMDIFEKATQLILEGVGREGLRTTGNQVNAALTEAIFFALMIAIERQDVLTAEQVNEAINTCKSDQDFIDAISSATANESQVTKRLALAVRYFEDI